MMATAARSEYSLRALFDLANGNADGPVKIADIAARQNIPAKFLEVVLAGLRQGGFVESRRGVESGYRLARSPESITVGEVLRHVDGKPSLRPRSLNGSDPLEPVWDQLDSALGGVVDRLSLADLVQRWRASSEVYLHTWDI